MDNELDLYQPGGLAPLIETDQPLIEQPWQLPEPTHQNQADQYLPVGDDLSFFGELLPAGTNPKQVDQVLGEIGGLFMSDFARLGHDPSIVGRAISWFTKAATQDPPMRINRRHRYQLYNYQNDILANEFANEMAQYGASQEFISNALWWVGELEKRLHQNAVLPPPRTPPTTSAEEYEHSLTDAQYARLEKINEQAKINTEIALKNRFGVTYAETMRVVNEYLRNLPLIEQQHFDTYVQSPNGPIHALNDLTVLTRLYEMAIGAGSIESGAGLGAEIEQIELLMKKNPKAYFADSRLQLRLRELYRRRDG